MTRRGMLGLSAKGAGAFALAASGLAVPRGFAGGGGGSVYVEAFPTSPLIVDPFKDPLTVPKALAPAGKIVDGKLIDATGNATELRAGIVDPRNNNARLGDVDATNAKLGAVMPVPSKEQQDCFSGKDSQFDYSYYNEHYGLKIGTHQKWPTEILDCHGVPLPEPVVYHLKVQASTHSFTSSKVQPINSAGQPIARAGTKNSGPQDLPQSTIWAFNGTFPGPRINAEYGKPALVRFENCLYEQVDSVYEPMDFGSPARTFLTHLHNGHTAPESDGNPHYAHHRFAPMGRFTHDAAFKPGEWIDQLYLGFAAGSSNNLDNDECEKQSFFWFHDHVHGHTGANVYKGMVGLMPLYDPTNDCGREDEGYRLPGVRTDNPDGSFDVDYDIPMALYDCRLDDGVTPHKDAHNGGGETHPEWWGKTYFRHFPNHGFVGDIMTVNGTAYPTLTVKRRKYRLRFLDASISRIYELSIMRSKNGPKMAKDLGYKGDELQGQWRLPDGVQAFKLAQCANEGGVLPNLIPRDSFELWPAKRREVVVDFSKDKDGNPTTGGQVFYLVNSMKMTTGRMWDSKDPNYKIPLVKIVIDDSPATDASMPLGKDASGNDLYLNLNDDAAVKAYSPLKNATGASGLRKTPNPVPDWQSRVKNAPTFELQRGSAPDDPETEWLINGQSFSAEKPMISVERDSADVWKIRNGGGGWVHPMHLHMEEHMVLMRNGKLAPDARHPDDTSKEDVVALDPSEEVVIARQFRTFTGPYVAHCHNLAHEDHNMMFGWEIVPPKSV